ncbi:RNA polymerase II-associated protein 2 [Entomortierella parvispora]|uniref:RNA polymerase II subunit B1 CTD phosphatase RPAP2 homolog n=1 Tax=Entomortierella parvispora TaxID=205924 RepID=A0A9P3H7Q2_9FUNG|nr:RNA polymerase II-associated protein 2 [Entomortierella parvispora]
MARNVATMKDDIVVDQSPIVQQYLPPKPDASTSADAMEETGEERESKEAKLNKKQILLQQNIELRKKFESMALHWQEVLCDTVSEQVLGESANRIKRSHYQETIEERNIGRLCGYPLCPNPPRDIKGKFRISLQERKVFDISVLKQFCSSTCLAASRWLEAQMTEEPLYLMNSDPDYLKETRVSIVPLGMELAEFQATRASNNMETTRKPSRPAEAFRLPTQDHEEITHQRPGHQPGQGGTQSSSSAAASGSLSEAYVQSILASVPETPSFIKIIEKDTQDETHAADMDQDMDSQGDMSKADDESEQQYDIIEGFKVPVPSSTQTQLRPPGVNKSTQDTRVIADKMAKVSLSESQDSTDTNTLTRSLSSMSMDTQ